VPAGYYLGFNRDRGSFRWQGASGPAVASPVWRLPQEAVPGRLAVESNSQILRRHSRYASSIGSGKIMSLARPIGLPKDTGGEAHHPVLANCKAGSAPND
jgi:hypothetical protein